MTDHHPSHPAPAGEPRTRKRWARPTLAHIDTSAAENTATPVGPDLAFSSGS